MLQIIQQPALWSVRHCLRGLVEDSLREIARLVVTAGPGLGDSQDALDLHKIRSTVRIFVEHSDDKVPQVGLDVAGLVIVKEHRGIGAAGRLARFYRMVRMVRVRNRLRPGIAGPHHGERQKVIHDHAQLEEVGLVAKLACHLSRPVLGGGSRMKEREVPFRRELLWRQVRSLAYGSEALHAGGVPQLCARHILHASEIRNLQVGNRVVIAAAVIVKVPDENVLGIEIKMDEPAGLAPCSRVKKARELLVDELGARTEGVLVARKASRRICHGDVHPPQALEYVPVELLGQRDPLRVVQGGPVVLRKPLQGAMSIAARIVLEGRCAAVWEVEEEHRAGRQLLDPGELRDVRCSKKARREEDFLPGYLSGPRDGLSSPNPGDASLVGEEIFDDDVPYLAAAVQIRRVLVQGGEALTSTAQRLEVSKFAV